MLQVLAKSLHAVAGQGNPAVLPDLGVIPSEAGGDAGDDFEREFAARLMDPGANAGSLLRSALGVVRDELLHAHAVEIDEVGTFEVKRSPPRLVRRQNRNQVETPPSVTFAFTPAPALVKAAGSRKPVFRPAPDLQRSVDALATTTLLVAVPAPDFFSDTLGYYFGKCGWTPKVVTSVSETLQHIQTAGAYAVVLDMSLPDAQKLCRTIKGRKETSTLPLVLLHAKGFNPAHPPAMMVTGDAFLVQPFEVRDLLTTVETELVRAAEEAAIFQHQVSFILPTDDEQVDAANDFGHKLFEQSGLTEEGQVALAAAFREAVGNAAQHGNRYRREKRIEVLYLLDREKITIVVKDSGEGFDHHRYVRFGRAGDALTAARERGREGKMGGLGIMLMLKCCEKIEYNQLGNAITLTKSIRPKPAAAAAAPAHAPAAAARR
jgi:anti-sigma regulatory factor (Ser/Thr protein kinase)/nucleoid DNA-binding protein